MGASPTVVRAFGPMAVESELCARLRSERDRVRADPRLLSSPLVVVTPSDGLRVHLAGLAARTVGALAGVRFVTVSRLAHDILMRAGQRAFVRAEVAAPFRRRGLGSYLLQELKRVCRESGGIPCARCSPSNLASQRTLKKAGFVPWTDIVTGPVSRSPA